MLITRSFLKMIDFCKKVMKNNIGTFDNCRLARMFWTSILFFPCFFFLVQDLQQLRISCFSKISYLLIYDFWVQGLDPKGILNPYKVLPDQ